MYSILSASVGHQEAREEQKSVLINYFVTIFALFFFIYLFFSLFLTEWTLTARLSYQTGEQCALLY